MKGKRVVITGASRGIGRETAKAIGKMGADLVLVVRDEGRGKQTAEEVRAEGGGGEVEVVVGDLSSLADVHQVADTIVKKHDRIDVLLNNAGAIIMDRTITKDGYEATFATNHLAYHLLTKRLLDTLKKAPEPRVVNVSSEFHRRGTIKFDDLMGERNWSALRAYAASKLANILFTTELARRLEGTNVTTNSLHPGAIGSNFGVSNGGVVGFLWKLAGPFLMNEKDGAKTSIYLATDPNVKVTGKYFEKCKERKPSREARNTDIAKKLWDVSEDLISKVG